MTGLYADTLPGSNDGPPPEGYYRVWSHCWNCGMVGGAVLVQMGTKASVFLGKKACKDCGCYTLEKRNA